MLHSLLLILLLCAGQCCGVELSNCTVGGSDGFLYEASTSSLQLQTLPPIVYVKTHKTGSSTLTNIFLRMADIRDLKVLAAPPHRLTRSDLGWPGQFPGVEVASLYHVMGHQVDVICHHAVYNRHAMEKYMRVGKVLYVTSLRDPYAQQLSCFNWFYKRKNISWNYYIEKAKAAQMQEVQDYHSSVQRARMRNPQALNLGWYELRKGNYHYDHDEELISKFLRRMEEQFDLFICQDQLDRGLVLLSHMLGVDINEMVYVTMKASDRHNYETPDEDVYRATIERLNAVDLALYKHFCGDNFESKWQQVNAIILESGGISLDDRLQQLQLMNRQLAEDCADERNHGTPRCHQSLLAGETPYSAHFVNKQFPGQRATIPLNCTENISMEELWNMLPEISNNH